MPDRKEYIEILSKAVKTVKEYNEDTPMKITLECVEDILELLKEQEAVEPKRCTDCINFDNYNVECLNRHNPKPPYGDWFCADWKRRTDDA